MLSFEEFFTKKNIDLAALKTDQPKLVEEFLLHYVQMGEKSFDHTKKYWFNRLRKEYKLPEPVEVPIAKTEKQLPSTVATSSQEASIAAKPTGFKPRFKSSISQPKEGTEEKEGNNPVDQQPTKPSGFKPRFKANISKAEDSTPIQEKSTEEQKNPIEEPSASKPTGFKPRFKAGKTTPKETEKPNECPTENPEVENATVAPKATGKQPSKAFGFKPGVVTSKETESVHKDIPEEHRETKDDTTEKEVPVSKPTGFKPRFKSGVTKNPPPIPPEEGSA